MPIHHRQSLLRNSHVAYVLIAVDSISGFTIEFTALTSDEINCFKGNSSAIFSTSTVCNYHLSSSRIFLPLPERKLYPCSCSPFSQLLSASSVCFVSMYLPVLELHDVTCCMCLLSPTVFRVHPCHCMYHYFSPFMAEW